MSERLNENYDSPKQKLITLEREVTKEYKEFQRLSKDTNVIKGLTKVFDKCWNEVIKDEAEKIGNLDVWAEMKDILNKHPDLWEYVSWTLKLPLSSVKFSQLNTAQKINYLALHDAFRYRRLKQLKGHKEPTNAENIINNCTANLKAYQARIESKFSSANLSNILVIETTLKNDFWLTNIEAQQVKKYLKLIKDHPEYVNQFQAKEAWFKSVAIGWLVGAIMWTLWTLFWVYYFNHLGDRPDTKIYWQKTEIWEPEEILKLLTQRYPFSKRWSIDKEMFTVDKNDNLLFQLWKEAMNRLQSRHTDMEINGHLAIEYDVQWYCKMVIDHDSWTVYLEVNEPDVVLVDSRSEVLSKNREWIHDKSFDNTEMELQAQLQQQSIDDLRNDPVIYEQAKKDSEATLLKVLKLLKPHWVEVKDLKVKYVKKKVPEKIPDWDRGNISVE